MLLVLVLPTISAAVTMLLLDRQAGTTFFTGDNGAVLWQHMFWFFGHPEVYIMVLLRWGCSPDHPGLLAEADLRLQGDRLLDDRHRVREHARLGAPHVHVGLSDPLQWWFMIASFSVAVPTAIKIFNWLATLWRGGLWFRAPLYFCLGFIALFTMGGLGIMLAAYPVDYQGTTPTTSSPTSTTCSSAAPSSDLRRHVLVPQDHGPYDERLARLHFWLMFVGFNAAFLPQHMLGLMGMPRRVYTYDREGLFEWYNLISTLGAFLMGISLLIFLERDEELAQRRARRERPVDGGHARVVRDLAAACVQLRQGALRLEPAPAARPAAEAEG